MKLKIISLMIILLLILTSCSILDILPNDLAEEDDKKEDEEVVETVIEYKNELLLPLTRLKTLNPLISEDLSYYHFSNLIFEGLFEIDNSFQVKKKLVDYYEVDETGKTVFIRLKDNIYWHDGEKLTAEDIAFTINTLNGTDENSVFKKTLRDYYGIYAPRNLNNLISYKILDTYEIELSFRIDAGNNLPMLTFPIVPQHRFSNYREALEIENYTPIGTGPFVFKSYDRNRFVKLESYSEYWDGKPLIDTVVGNIVEDNDLMYTSFESGQVHLSKAISFDWDKYRNRQDINIYEFISSNYEFLGFNFNSPLFSAEIGNEIRKGIMYSIDREDLIEKALLGHGINTNLPINPNSYLMKDANNYYGFNLEIGKDILARAGYEDRNGDGYLEDIDGNRLSIRLATSPSNEMRIKVADLIADYLEDLGIGVKKEYSRYDSEDWNTFIGKILNDDFDIVLIGWKLSQFQDMSKFFHTQSPKEFNFINYSKEEMDNLLTEVYLTNFENEGTSTFNRLHDYVSKELPYISLFFTNDALLATSRLQGDIDPSFFNWYKNIESWYFEDIN